MIQRILTTPVDGLDNYQQMMRRWSRIRTALKVYVEVAEG